MRKQMKGYGFYIIILLIVVAAVILSQNYNFKNSDEYSYSQFIDDIKDSNIKSMEIAPNKDVPTGNVTVTMKDDSNKSVSVPDVNVIISLAGAADIVVHTNDVPKENFFLSSILPYILVFVVIIVLFSFISNQASVGGGNSKVMNFGKSRAKMTTEENKTTTFKNVAGLEEEKEELKEIVDFLKSPKKYIQVGARIP